MRLVLLSLALLAAGCVTPPPGDVAPGATARLGAFLDPIIDDHDHASWEEHQLFTPNMHLTGYTTMTDDGKPLSYIGEMDTWQHMTVVQVLGRGSPPGFVILDTSDPAAPRPIGRALMPYSYVVDVKWSPDGQYVFAASQERPAPTPAAPFESTVTGWGFTQFDVSDPTAPTAIAGAFVANGCHMLSVKELGGELTVFCATVGSVHVFQYLDGGAWTEVSVIPTSDGLAGIDELLANVVEEAEAPHNAARRGVGAHDVTVQEDPLAPGRWIASIPSWDLGLRFYDVTDPTRPMLVGSWSGEDAEVYEGNVHGAALYAHGERRLAIVGPELLGQTVPALWILDVTDIAAPTLVAEWVPPGEHLTQGLLLTTHQFQVVDGRIYLAYNHAGVWVLDLATILAGGYADDPSRPDVLGYYLPHADVALFDPDASHVPDVWDVNVKDGYVFASDRYTGFFVLHHADDPRGDPALTSST